MRLFYLASLQLLSELIRLDRRYIGAIQSQTQPMCVYENESFVTRDVTFVPGLFKIFDEIMGVYTTVGVVVVWTFVFDFCMPMGSCGAKTE